MALQFYDTEDGLGSYALEDGSGFYELESSTPPYDDAMASVYSYGFGQALEVYEG